MALDGAFDEDEAAGETPLAGERNSRLAPAAGAKPPDAGAKPPDADDDAACNRANPSGGGRSLRGGGPVGGLAREGQSGCGDERIP